MKDQERILTSNASSYRTVVLHSSLPLLSFVVVNYNYGRFLRACVESIMSQTYSNFECVVIDNASTDDSYSVLEGLARKSPSLRVIHNDENVGQSAACAQGFALSGGDYVAFIDADDYLLPDFAATHVRVHLSLPSPVGFTSSDMAEMVNDRLVLGRLGHFGKNESYPVDPRSLRDIRDIGAVLGSDELESPDLYADLRSVPKTNTHWIWSSTSGTVYRSDAVRLFASNPRLRSLRFATDCYFNYPINALSGSVLIEKSLSVYRIHGENNFTKRAALEGTIAFKRENDEGAKAALFALEHIVAEFDSFCAQCRNLSDLSLAMRTLHKKSGTFKWHFGERVRAQAMRYYFTRVVAYLRTHYHLRLGR